LEYFVRNPRAADDVEGVTRFRLLDQQIHRAVDETHDALQWLVAAGFLRQATTAGTRAIFSLNAEKQAQALRFLAQQIAREATEGPESRPEPEDEDGGDR
jgi:hypothetical protein